ncbi:1,4-alpha-glucan branching protein GlgB [Clostridium butyricum]|uniref:1,4-alpha-glucan branching enzyme n=1 Tax=Clostridium butyricum TaxID=1492 RepID=A0AAP9UEX0_CLOBU|nr:1,4-alpha-glucan branching protein GlgB [Clostridium butyricum]MBZ5747401.1 1,4-alpha-glucan branching protein GlgB [Clostridium butyricum]QMW91580.1 1,4-alpha-glucan branching protein GlgB [Clostridium butyricum]BBK76217.1 1,4-alpha-glucan branching enzyme GlgB [Clostridium butyricum]GEQ26436.1 1,4-alpha-glucan branching enzyme GlgB [Clostridium butyricum]
MINNNEINNILQGNSLDAYNTFGAHFSYEYQQHGVRFTVYAPNAERVLLVGTFNDWSGYDMELHPSGVWSIFVKDVPEMSLYKYRIFTKENEIIDKIDPFAFFSELRPDTASIVYNINDFQWTDDLWMNSRTKNFNSPLNIYEVHLSSWKIKDNEYDFYNYNEIADIIIPYVKEMGYTHIELLPITEHPFDGSWGYQVSGYFSATSRYGNPKDLMKFINKCHNENIGVILDVVPAHFVKDSFSLSKYDGSYIYESNSDENRSSEWDTNLFDFTKPYVISFVRSSLDFWLSYYHMDGLRYDAVSIMIYESGDLNKGVNEAGLWFLRSSNFALQNRHQNVMLIAEDSSVFSKITAPVVYGGVGFDYKWNFGWMHDSLEYFQLTPYDRSSNRHKLKFSIEYFYNELYLLPVSHDEVSHFKNSVVNLMYGDYDEKFSNLKCFYLFMMTHPGKKLNFMGNEIGQFETWHCNKEIDWDILDYPKHMLFKNYFSKLQEIYSKESSLYKNEYNKNSFNWIQTDDNMPCIFAYKRNDLEEDCSYTVLNLGDSECYSFLLQVDSSGWYDEIINTDSEKFGGKNKISKKKRAKLIDNNYYISIYLNKFNGVIVKKSKKLCN